MDKTKVEYKEVHHTFSTLLTYKRVHAKNISERLGHSDIKTTMNVYGHALKQADEIATEKLDNALFKNNKAQ